ncbi:hypothetical protein SXCC_03431 [Gluconacetobacter sp. SXCC-1]|nr:hypothetical protein SXCC_03431 [Gluconacetobacter sp. SXCC-1]
MAAHLLGGHVTILSISAAKGDMPGKGAMACNFNMEFARASGLA